MHFFFKGLTPNYFSILNSRTPIYAANLLTPVLQQASRLINPSAFIGNLHSHGSMWYYTNLDMPFTHRIFHRHPGSANEKR